MGIQFKRKFVLESYHCAFVYLNAKEDITKDLLTLSYKCILVTWQTEKNYQFGLKPDELFILFIHIFIFLVRGCVILKSSKIPSSHYNIHPE